MTSTPAISVVIRTSNSAPSLGALLSRLNPQPDDEIIIVDTRSRDRTVEIASSAGARIIHNDQPFNHAHTLNLGFAAAVHPWVLVLSSHCLPVDDTLLTRYRKIITNLPENIVVIYGLQAFSRQQLKHVDKAFSADRGVGPSDRFHGGGNPNALYSREAWQRHPFDETLKTGEDLAWRTWALDAGFACAVAPSAGVLYRHPGGLVYRFRKARDEVLVIPEPVAPMTLLQLALGIGQATRRLLLEEGAVRSWLGQIGHLAGIFAATPRRR